MPLTVYTDTDIDPTALPGPVAVIGYGAQGRAQAQNLRDSGHDVVIGLRDGSDTIPQAEADGFAVKTIENAAKLAKTVVLLCPDEVHGTVYTQIAPHFADGGVVVLAHGFSLHFGIMTPNPNHDVVLVAPKGQGGSVRSLYQAGHGVCVLMAVHQNATGHAKARALAYAGAIGSGRAGVLETTVRDETETDLFGEQAVLCGGVFALLQAGFETLTDAGYAPELAYFECVHELKLIADLLYKIGPADMAAQISNAAEFGAMMSGPQLVTDGVRQNMKSILANIQNGDFAKALMSEAAQGYPNLERNRTQQASHPIEDASRTIRKLAGTDRVGDAE